MKRTIRIAPVAALLLLLAHTSAAKSPAKPSLEAQLDAVAASYFKSDAPGAAILVVRDGKPLLRKGYGMADLELGVPVRPDHVFRIGSITKQFTSVAILQLVEQGKIALDDPITKFLPDYPTQGKTITIEHLLTHTSGIQSYTDRAGFTATLRNDLTPPQLIDTFKNDPMQFSPGERFAYNNSAYVLLGAIIERVTGQRYGDYLAANVFPRAGLTQTYYGDAARIIPKRIAGYGEANGTIVNARYLSMSIPYSAGSILSTVDDLAKWTAAVAAGKVVRPDLLERAWTPFTLTNGESTGYGYGWKISELFGHRAIGHGGGIMGFSAQALWIPEQKVFVALLANSEETPVSTDYLARRLATYAIGRPWNPVAIPMTAEELREYEGVYRIDEKTTRTLLVEDGRLFSQRTGSPKMEVFPSARDRFFFKDAFTSIAIERGADGRIAAMTVTGADGKADRAPRTDEPVNRRVAIAVDPEKLDRYTGRYEVSPQLTFTVRRKGNELWAQARGPREIQLFAESETKWYLKEAGADVTFEFDATGKASTMTVNLGGQPRVGRRVE